jgi:hypothetical protein
MNSTYLKDINLKNVTLNQADVHALGQCSNVKKFTLFGCLFPPTFEMALSILQHLNSLEYLDLHGGWFSMSAVDVLIRCCRSVKSIRLSMVQGMGDDEVFCLVQGCHALRSLSLTSVNITNESVRMLMNDHPQIPSIGITDCVRVSWINVLEMLRKITIPQIFMNDNPEIQNSALENLTLSVPSFFEEESELLFQNSLLERLVELLQVNKEVRSSILSFFLKVSWEDFYQLVVDAGAVPVIIRLFNSFEDMERYYSLSLLESLSAHDNLHQHLFSSGVLSIIRSSHYQVRGSLTSLP